MITYFLVFKKNNNNTKRHTAHTIVSWPNHLTIFLYAISNKRFFIQASLFVMIHASALNDGSIWLVGCCSESYTFN